MQSGFPLPTFTSRGRILGPSHGERGSANLLRGSGDKAPSGVEEQNPWSGAKPPEADDILIFESLIFALNKYVIGCERDMAYIAKIMNIPA